jgi:hypothetical protein
VPCARYLLTTVLCLLTQASVAQSLEGVLMPGKVISGHAKLEADCSQCHVRFDRAAQDRLCLDCHKDVAVDVSGKKGYHGRIEARPCRACHTEHKGREANIAPLGRFEHRLTDFPLRGAHASPKLECKSCHNLQKPYRDVPADCVACHKKDDKHKGSLGPKCADCHTEANWKQTRFDHAKTRFPLLGKHASVECKACHKSTNFKEAPMACIGCHKKDDKHKGHFGEKCETCHTAKAWPEITFNHDTQTKYPLRGKHRQVKCDSCHTGDLYRDKLQSTCIACHKKDDKHEGQLGTKCDSCHVEQSWKKTSFDHSRTDFPLLGRHAMVECKSCHTTSRYKDAKRECVACHAKDDVHKRRLGPRCETCHNARDWKAWDFNHDRKTKFPLDGGHRKLDCYACHRSATDKAPTLGTSCVSCHAADDVHDGSFGRQCERCHVTSSFKQVKALTK